MGVGGGGARRRWRREQAGRKGTGSRGREVWIWIGKRGERGGCRCVLGGEWEREVADAWWAGWFGWVVREGEGREEGGVGEARNDGELHRREVAVAAMDLEGRRGWIGLRGSR